MSEREKGPGPTLPEMPAELYIYGEPEHEGFTGLISFHNRDVAEMTRRDDVADGVVVGGITHYRRADLAPDPERAALVAEVLRHAALHCHVSDSFTEAVEALEAHDAKGEAGDDAATRPPSPHSP